ncbi:MAG: 4Fe-4S dicluster domain-containing protein [Desulfovibrionaceae bacterium]
MKEDNSGLGFFIDLSACDACKGCQVACEQWKDQPTIPTKNTGSYQNPPDLNPEQFKLVRFEEKEYNNKVEWLFFPEQCRHCFDAPCQAEADMNVEGAITTDPATGIVLYHEKTKELTNFEDVREACPYNIPRRDEKTKLVSKCNLCFDRIQEGMIPSCVLTCHSGCMNYGTYDEMYALAHKRLEEVKPRYPQAQLGDPNSVRIIYLYTFPPSDYYEYAVADASDKTDEKKDLSRRQFFATLGGGKKPA